MAYPKSFLPFGPDAALDEMESLLSSLTWVGNQTPQAIVESLLHYEEIVERLFRLLIFYHRGRSNGWLLTLSAEEIYLRMDQFLESWYSTQSGIVGLSEEFVAVNRWLGHCDQYGFG